MPLYAAEHRLPELLEFMRAHSFGPSSGGPQPAVVSTGQAASASGEDHDSIRVPPQADSTRPMGTLPPSESKSEAPVIRHTALNCFCVLRTAHGAPQRSVHVVPDPSQEWCQRTVSIVLFVVVF